MANRYPSDNGVFILYHLRSDCQGKKQTQYFSGVGEKHQNGKSERAIQTISYWSQKIMTHVVFHWPSDNADSVWLWVFSVTHAAWMYNIFQTRIWIGCLQWISSPRPRVTTVIYLGHEFGDAWPFFSTPSYKITRIFQILIGGVVWVNYWDPVMNIALWWPWS